MTRKRVGRHLEGGRVPDDEREERRRGEALREVFSRWATGVTIVAVRDQGKVHGLTVSAFMPVSLDPPLVLVGLGPNASALPFLAPGVSFTVSILGGDQRGLASRFADSFPVGASPFPAEGPPVVRDAIATMTCVVEEVRVAGDHHLVTGRVVEARVAGDGPALGYFRRVYHSIG
jgi:flavin reductase (DIM6/NTAB) family NADH-FMN oxidoreductase RutF